ncbi:hypothetical protein [Microbacterium sp.]|uniref:hypothetical protein n=1 Tax=Microbacterium sp. TaxID=51671 RepID=UPI002811C862|nr:hypothetical protein [Microbacterium sp.]
MEILRLAGVPGVGKSAVGWTVARRLATEGERCGYVDIDQLGMCYPAPSADPDRWMLKESALARVANQFQSAGVERLVVSGVADPSAAPPHPGHPTTSLWLDAAGATRRARLASRGWPEAQVEAVLAVGDRESAGAHRSWSRLATDALTVAETADAVLERWSPTGDEASVAGSEDDPAAARPARVIWITGPRCAGASQVGWEIASAQWRAKRRTGFVDVAQLAFAWNTPHDVGLRNTVEMHRAFSDAAAGMLVAVAPFRFEPAEVIAAFPGAEVSFVRLDADDDALRDRVEKRADGSGEVMLAGDDLAGASQEAVAAVIAEGIRQRRVPVRPGERIVDTTGVGPDAVAERVLEL